MIFYLYDYASFWHGFVTGKVVYFVCILFAHCCRRKHVFCDTFDILLIRRIISQKPCAARVFVIGGTSNHITTNFMSYSRLFRATSVFVLLQPQGSSRNYGIGYRPDSLHQYYVGISQYSTFRSTY